LKPHLRKTWCIGTINAAFLAQMERLLWLYSLPLDPGFPVVCFDERPCFLIGERVEALALKAGSPRKEHYEYAKHGSCVLLGAVEPLTGRRLAQVFDHRCKREYALFLRELAAQFPAAVKDPAGAGQLEHALDECVASVSRLKVCSTGSRRRRAFKERVRCARLTR
jgi:hypothetical protein